MMKRNKKRLLKVSLCSLMLSMGMNVQASGIPTIDGAVLGQGVQSFMEYLQQYTEQLNTWDIEEQNFTKHFKSVTTGMDIASEVFGGLEDGKMLESLKNMGFQKFYQQVFQQEGNDYIQSIANKGIEGLTGRSMSVIQQMYPKNGDINTAEGRAKNAVHEACGVYDGIMLDLTRLDEAKLLTNQAAARSMVKTMSNIKGKATDTGEESASKVGSVQAALDIQSKEYAKGEQEYIARRQEMVEQIESYRKRCENAQIDFARIAATAIGVGAKIESLKFGSGSRSKTSFDPRF